MTSTCRSRIRPGLVLDILSLQIAWHVRMPAPAFLLLECHGCAPEGREIPVILVRLFLKILRPHKW